MKEEDCKPGSKEGVSALDRRSRRRIIDADVHNAFKRRSDLLPYLPRTWHEQWLMMEVGVPVIYYSPMGVMRRDATTYDGDPPGSDPHYLKIHHLDAYGIEYAILNGSGIIENSLNADPDYANAVASAYNDWLIDTWLQASNQYKGSLVVNASDPLSAAAEIDRIGSHPDMVQVILCSTSRTPYGQRFFHPIYEAAERHGLPVAIHPGSEGRGIAGAPTPSGYPTRYLEWHNILPTNFMAQINSFVCEGVFEKFPGLKVVAIEGGISWLPHLMWRMDKNYKALRDSVPWLKRLPSEYIQEHILLTTQPIEEPANPKHLASIFEMFDAGNMVMFSSDYPHWDFDNPRMALSPLPRQMRQKIFFETASRLYGLD